MREAITTLNNSQSISFLRFVFKAYRISARVNIRWMNQNDRPRSNKCRVLQILYASRARTMDEMRGNFKEIWEMIWEFPRPPGLEYVYDVKYNGSQIRERNRWNGRAYAHMAMCVGKGDMSYLPAELREKILSC